MQKSGIVETGPNSEKTDSEATPRIKNDLEGTRRRITISDIFQRKRANKQPPAELPTKKKFKDGIDDIFEHSEKAQPSKPINVGAGVADLFKTEEERPVPS
ncbi:MAG: hypothetical protein NTY73_04430 [Candidatus Micrarchaeota archaeon]|nr:hypothetical protein [Candidatus Micrarchaeota archaeon]